jgi:hypothetical protein
MLARAIPGFAVLGTVQYHLQRPSWSAVSSSNSWNIHPSSASSYLKAIQQEFPGDVLTLVSNFSPTTTSDGMSTRLTARLASGAVTCLTVRPLPIQPHTANNIIHGETLKVRIDIPLIVRILTPIPINLGFIWHRLHTRTVTRNSVFHIPGSVEVNAKAAFCMLLSMKPMFWLRPSWRLFHRS